MTFSAFLAEPRAARCWLLELDAFPLAPLSVETPSGAFDEAAFSEMAFSEADADSYGAVETLCYSDRGYASKSTDTPASTYYGARLREDLAIERKLYGRAGVGGFTRIFGAISLINTDGALDTLLRDYAIDGRNARLRVGRPTDARADFGLVFAGVVDRATVSLDRVELQLSDGLARLDVPLNSTVYAGTGSLEGGSDLAGKPKPKGYGVNRNISPPLVESALLIYQVHDGVISDVPSCWDRQIALTKGADYASQSDMTTNAPAAGQYRVWKGGGFIRLGSTPAGTVTCDLLGDATGSYIDKTADIVQRLLTNAGLSGGEIAAAAIAALNTAAPAVVGTWRGAEPAMVSEVVEELLAGVGAFGGFNRSGLFTCAVIDSAAGSPAAAYTETEILDLVREPLPAPVEPAVWRALVAWQKNYTVQTDLASGVTAARRTFAAESERVSVKDNATVQSQHRLAMVYGPTGNLYDVQADADTEGQRLLDLWSSGRMFLRATLPPTALERDLGDEVTLTHARFGLASGAGARVLGHAVRIDRVDLTVLV